MIKLQLFNLFLLSTLTNCQTTSTTRQTTTSTPSTITTTASTTPYNVPCSSIYSVPEFSGTCMPISECTGAGLSEICANGNYVCCIPDPQLTTEAGENTFITLNRYLKFVGNTTRNRRFYYLFKRSIADAGITTCHAASAYFAQLLGVRNF